MTSYLRPHRSSRWQLFYLILVKKVVIKKSMAMIENEQQYNWAVARVEELLPLVDENTPCTDANRIELELLSNLVADYSEKHFSIG